jgi:hypothetical protein
LIYKKLLIIITGMLSLLLVSCKENPTSVGLDLLKNDLVGVKSLDSYSDSLQQKSSYFQKVMSLGGGTTLLLGKDINVEASSLIKFYFSGLADTTVSDIKSNVTQVVSATVYMYPIYNFGDTLAAFDFSVHQINSDWTSAGFDADSIASFSYNSTDISSNRVVTDTVTSFDIPGSIVSGWIKAYSDSNFIGDEGIYLTPSSVVSQRIIGYQALSLNSSTATILKIVLYKPGSYSDTLSFYPTSDLAVVKGFLPSVSPTNIVVQGGLTARSKLWFDASKIPNNAVINQAILTLTIDTTQSVFGPNSGNSITVFNLSDSASSLIDSSKSISLTKNGNIISGDISSLVQKWIDSKNNQGLILQDTYQSDEVELFVFRGSKDSNHALRPRLKIIYTLRN